MLAEREWTSLLESISASDCTPFLGAGVAYPHLPLGATLAKSLALAHNYPLPDTYNLARVAQFVSITMGSPYLKRDVIKRLRELEEKYYEGHKDFPPDNYQILAGLGQKRYVTTNYDGFMERALDRAKRNPIVESCRWSEQLWDDLGDYPVHTPTREEPILFHLHGQFKDDLSILITEDDYIDFTVTMAVRGAQESTQSALWSQIRRALGSTRILFIGYSLEDWNFRVMLKYLVRQQKIFLDPTYQGFSIQLSPTSATNRQDAEDFLSEYLSHSNVKVFWIDAAAFLQELHERMK